MSQSPLGFSELTTRDLRAVKRLTSRLLDAPDMESLGREFVSEMSAILPADCMLWDAWTPAMDEILSFEANHPQLRQALVEYASALSSTIRFHPVIATGHLAKGKLAPQRMTDFQCHGAFKETPLFRDVYRHLETHYQIAYIAADLEDANIVMSWNRKHRDFNRREMQLLHLSGLQAGMLSRRLDQHRRLRTAWMSLSCRLAAISGLDITLVDTELQITPNDGRLLAGLVKGESRACIAARLNWRRDTLDRRIGYLRERLGFESTPQLLHCLAALRPENLIDSGTWNSWMDCREES